METDEAPIPEQMYNAVQAGDLVTFKRLLEEHPEEEKYENGRSAWLETAASAGHVPIVEYLISTGIDVNEPHSAYSVPCPEGVIVRAADEGHLKMVEWLLNHGAKINHVVDGQTRCFALTGAARDGHLDVVKLLVERGAMVNSSWANMTPLDHVEMYGQDEVANYLRSVGAKRASELG